MCGITGLYAFNEIGRFHMINLQKSIDLIQHRGPDFQNSYLHERVGMGHRRLAVIDLSPGANQPMSDSGDRYWIVYNGEIYNYKSLRDNLIREGMSFKTQSDTEVVLNAFIRYGVDCLEKLNGFFTFAIYDQQNDELFIARDRFGIKPLYYFLDEDKLIFASELRSVLAFGIERSINLIALHYFLQLNYIPGPLSIINGVHKLLPGNYIQIKEKRFETRQWYHLPVPDPEFKDSEENIKKNIRTGLEKSIERRLVADVPVGTFLSGGIDSSIITGLAAGMKNGLNTFSIGYSDDPFFDETKYSRMVAGHFKTNHTEFILSKKDLYENLNAVLDHIDEPFADSSALPVYILSRETKKHVTVALSGDGADELFAGYNKHLAFYRSLHPGVTENTVYSLRFLWKILPQSRNDTFSNKVRQLRRFCEGHKLSPPYKYWFWSAMNNEAGAGNLLNPEIAGRIDQDTLSNERKTWLAGIDNNMESVLIKDLLFMLPNDMLFKVDLMSMAHGLEVRIPFLDHELVEYVSGLPAGLKIPNGRKKALLLSVFEDFLPETILNRSKKGFEVPLLRWMRTGLKSTIEDELLEDGFIRDQGIFNPGEIALYKKRLFSRSPGDVHAHLWALIVFQWWWKKYLS